MNPTTPVKEATTKTAIITPEDNNNKDRMSEWVKEPHENDVLCGRGGSINSHPGNERFRQLVEKRKRVYLTARFKREKRLIASSVVSEIRGLNPPGRFLSRDGKSGLWQDIGDEKARDKTSQALRENAPTLRAEIETEINQQRAEMQREEEVALSTAPSGPQNPPSYYPNSWGYSYPYYGYGYGHPQMGPPGPPPPHAAGYPPDQAPYGEWNGEEPYYEYPEEQMSAAFEQTANFVSSVPSNIVAWTKASMSFGGYSQASSLDNDEHEENPKPIVYKHRPTSISAHGGAHRRAVRFMDEGNNRGRPPHRRRNMLHGRPMSGPRPLGRRPMGRPRFRSGPRPMDPSERQHPGPGYNRELMSYSPIHNQNSIIEEEDEGYDTASPVLGERSHQPRNPQPIKHSMTPTSDTTPQEEEQSVGILSRMGSQIIGSLGSWDTSIMSCAHDSVDEYGGYSVASSARKRDEQVQASQQEETMAYEYEGQEVQLQEDDTDGEREETMNPDDRMPPPAPRVQIDWPSRVGSCHSWIPDTLGAASFFSSQNSRGGSLPVSPAESMDMEMSVGMSAGMSATEGFSCTGSVGGASLCHVFDRDGEIAHGIAQGMPSPHQLDHRVLNQMPSWERSFRSLGDDESLISKTSEKSGTLSPIHGASTPTGMSFDDQKPE